MPHSFSYAVSMNLEHSIKEGSHERYPDHFQCFRNIKKIKYPDFQAMTNIETYAVSGIAIIVPDISVTFILNQLILIHLNIQQKVSICTSSF